MVGGVLNVNSTAKLIYRRPYYYTPNYGNKWFWFIWFPAYLVTDTNDGNETGIDYITDLNIGISPANETVYALMSGRYTAYSFCIEIK